MRYFMMKWLDCKSLCYKLNYINFQNLLCHRMWQTHWWEACFRDPVRQVWSSRHSLNWDTHKWPLASPGDPIGALSRLHDSQAIKVCSSFSEMSSISKDMGKDRGNSLMWAPASTNGGLLYQMNSTAALLVGERIFLAVHWVDLSHMLQELGQRNTPYSPSHFPLLMFPNLWA